MEARLFRAEYRVRKISPLGPAAGRSSQFKTKVPLRGHKWPLFHVALTVALPRPDTNFSASIWERHFAGEGARATVFAVRTPSHRCNDVRHLCGFLFGPHREKGILAGECRDGQEPAEITRWQARWKMHRGTSSFPRRFRWSRATFGSEAERVVLSLRPLSASRDQTCSHHGRYRS